MKFLDNPEPSRVPGWWGTRLSLLTDRFTALRCDAKVRPRGGGNRRRCKNTARFYAADVAGHPLTEHPLAYCLQHMRQEVGEP